MSIRICQAVGFFDPPQMVSAQNVVGVFVKDHLGRILGTIEELVFDADEGRVAYAVMKTQAQEIMEARLVAVPWKAFTFIPEEETFLFEMDRGILDDAPGVERTGWAQVTERQWLMDLYRYYGYSPYWK